MSPSVHDVNVLQLFFLFFLVLYSILAFTVLDALKCVITFSSSYSSSIILCVLFFLSYYVPWKKGSRERRKIRKQQRKKMSRGISLFFPFCCCHNLCFIYVLWYFLHIKESRKNISGDIRWMLSTQWWRNLFYKKKIKMFAVVDIFWVNKNSIFTQNENLLNLMALKCLR